MKYFQQLDGTEIFIIHKVNNKIMVGGTNETYYAWAPEEVFVQIEDRYILTKETLPVLIEELEKYVEKESEEN